MWTGSDAVRPGTGVSPGASRSGQAGSRLGLKAVGPSRTPHLQTCERVSLHVLGRGRSMSCSSSSRRAASEG